MKLQEKEVLVVQEQNNTNNMGLDVYFTRKKTSSLGYFRKVNFLVKYFADLGFDVDHQTPFCINKGDIKELLDRCNEVLENHDLAEELLPTMSGFFFGNTDYNEYYFDDVKQVKDYIENELLPEFDNLTSDEDIYFETWY